MTDVTTIPAIANGLRRVPTRVEKANRCIGEINPEPNPVGVVGDEWKWTAITPADQRYYGLTYDAAIMKLVREDDRRRG